MTELDFFYLLSPILGYVMRWLYMLVNNYGWAIVIFTFIVRIAMFPLSLKQQKSQSRMSAYQPMIQEIQKKWANDKNKQNQEVQKFYQENNIKMSAGCAPMIINFLVLFGIIGVIQSPLSHILQIDSTDLSSGYAIVQSYDPDSNIEADTYTQQTLLTGEIKKNPQRFIDGIVVELTDEDVSSSSSSSASVSAASSSAASSSGLPAASMTAGDDDPKVATTKLAMSEESVKAVNGFNFNISFFGASMNLATVPDFSQFWTLVMPILSLLTMVVSQVIIMRTSGQSSGKASMWIMTIVMGVMFGFFAFRVPLGFSLYYTISNVVMTLQQLILRKIYDPKKIREEVEREIEERRLARKNQKKKVKTVVQEVNGELVATELSEADNNKMRLEKARLLDAKRYSEEAGDEEDEDDEDEDERTKKAREIDELRYSQTEEPTQGDDDDDAAGPPALPAPPAKGEVAQREPDESVIKDDVKPEYKPGRRKRARKSKMAANEDNFADKERSEEEQSSDKKEDDGNA